VSAHEFTSDQITETIATAIRERDLDVVPGLIRLLALQDPGRAQLILDTVDLARVIAKARQS
jgi:hypothetical protein